MKEQQQQKKKQVMFTFNCKQKKQLLYCQFYWKGRLREQIGPKRSFTDLRGNLMWKILDTVFKAEIC